MGWRDLQQELRSRMTREQASLVRRLRVEERLTWSGVAEEFYDERPDELYGADLRGNQGVGMFLCEACGGAARRGQNRLALELRRLVVKPFRVYCPTLAQPSVRPSGR
jgi:hypothetical protein